MLFVATASFPAFVRGPVDFKAFCRFAAVLLSITSDVRFWFGSLAFLPSDDGWRGGSVAADELPAASQAPGGRVPFSEQSIAGILRSCSIGHLMSNNPFGPARFRVAR